MTLREFFPPLAAKRLTGLDGLRGLAALFIFNTHFLAQFADVSYFLTPGSPSFRLTAVIHSGLIGVDAFFMLSGLLTYLSLAAKNPAPGAFILARYRRLLPVILAVSVPALCFGAGSVDPRQLIDNIFFLKLFRETTYVNHVAWALTYEMYFYLLCLVWFLLPQKAGLPMPGKAAFTVLALVFLANVIFFKRLGPLCDVRFLGFFYGVGLGMFLRSRTFERLRARAGRLPRLWPVFLAMILCCGFLWSYPPTQRIIFTEFWGNFAFYCLLDPAYAGLILCLALGEDAAGGRTVFSSLPMRLLGVVSYSLFMTHAQWGIPLGRTLIPGGVSSFAGLCAAYAASLAVSLAIAVFLFYFVERAYFARSKTPVRPAVPQGAENAA